MDLRIINQELNFRRVVKSRMHSRLVILLFISVSFQGFTSAQNLFRPNYPEGIYKDLESFLAKEPTSTAGIKAVKEGAFWENDYSRWNWNDSVPDHCDFRYIKTAHNVNSAFAISYQGYLFFNNKAMVKKKYRHPNDNDQYPVFPAGYSRVTIGGSNFYYCDLYLQSKAALGVNGGPVQGGMVGGAISGAVSGTISGFAQREKGVVFNWKLNQFNILTNCKDLNAFMETFYPLGVQTCFDRKYRINQLRSDMTKLCNMSD